MGLRAWGSFEGRSGVVRNAVVFAGMPDPGETRMLLQDRGDVDADDFADFLLALQAVDPDRRGLSVAKMVELAQDADEVEDMSPKALAGARAHLAMRDSIVTMLGRLDAKALAYKLRCYYRRNLGGLYLDHTGEERKGAASRRIAFCFANRAST